MIEFKAPVTERYISAIGVNPHPASWRLALASQYTLGTRHIFLFHRGYASAIVDALIGVHTVTMIA